MPNAEAICYPEQLSAETPAFGASAMTEPPYDWLSDLVVPDLPWIVNTASSYATALQMVPDTFAWKDSSTHFAILQTLLQSMATRRLRSCFDYIGRHDSSLLHTMQSLFDKLPAAGKLRFTTAPETYFQITRMRREPVETVIYLCNALNGEAAYYDLGPTSKGYVTALGDFYCSQIAPDGASESDGNESAASLKMVRAPLLAGKVPIDFDSPNVANAQETRDHREYLKYSPDEQALICERLEEALKLIETVSENAASLIKTFIKVIVPLKPPTGYGSTSQCRIPGRVLLSGVERCSLAALASSMVHEAMHQLLYIIEFNGSFITPDPDANTARAKSLWTGRDLPLHSFIHACFIWYGLSNFWAQAQVSGKFERPQVEQEFSRSISGFCGQNPVETLAPHAGMVRYDVYKIANSLQGRLKDVIPQVV